MHDLPGWATDAGSMALVPGDAMRVRCHLSDAASERVIDTMISSNLVPKIISFDLPFLGNVMRYHGCISLTWLQVV
jgi:hypothetical protein